MFQVHQQGAAGIAHVGAVPLLSAEVPQQPALHRAEAEIIIRGSTGCARLMPHQPANLAGAEVGIEEQAGASSPFLLKAFFFPLLTDIGGAAVLPDQGGAAGLPIAASPQDRGFPLIGDSAGHHSVPLFLADGLLQALHRQALALPDVPGVLFHPSVSWIADG